MVYVLTLCQTLTFLKMVRHVQVFIDIYFTVTACRYVPGLSGKDWQTFGLNASIQGE